LIGACHDRVDAAVSVELYLSFVLATMVVLAIPGPTILLVMSYALGQGRRAVAPAVAGVALGDATSVTLSLLGLGAILSLSASLFAALKWIGAAYLIWLGVRMWRAGPARRDLSDAEGGGKGGRRGAILGHTYLVTALNPKSIAFYIAFMPQFVVPDVAPAPQFALLGATFVVLGIANALVYGLCVSRLRGGLGPIGSQAHRIGGATPNAFCAPRRRRFARSCSTARTAAWLANVPEPWWRLWPGSRPTRFGSPSSPVPRSRRTRPASWTRRPRSPSPAAGARCACAMPTTPWPPPLQVCCRMGPAMP
jgi:threonine/homoserine/homoserine lactone efflux protein